LPDHKAQTCAGVKEIKEEMNSDNHLDVFDRNDCSPELISWGRQVAIANERASRPQ
jgi:hypothetical protein